MAVAGQWVHDEHRVLAGGIEFAPGFIADLDLLQPGAVDRLESVTQVELHDPAELHGRRGQP